MTELLTSPVHLCTDVADLVGRAQRWLPGMPFPLMACPALDRFRAVVGATLPEVGATLRAGRVLSTGGPVSRAAGMVLAAATGRPHQHVPADEVVAAVAGDEPVAVVALAVDFAAVGDWPADRNPRAGVLVARTPETLFCLVYRTLVPEAGARADTFVVSNPFHHDELDADAVELAELGPLRTERHKLVVLHLHGRECSAGMPDAIICGRSDGGVPPPPSPDHRIPSCLRGEGCYRSDLGEDQRIEARELHAVLVFAQSCSAVAVGASAFPPEVGLGSGFLEGTVTAVIGGMGAHMAEPGAEREIRAHLAEGLPLGEVVARLNGTGRGHRGGMATFGLLGDPGLVLGPAAGSSVAGADDPGAALDELRHLNEVVLPRCERLPWLELTETEDRLPGLRARLRALAHRPGPSVRALSDDLAAAQLDLVRAAAARAQREGADFLGDSSVLFDQSGRAGTVCGNCGRSAVRLTMRHRLDSSLVVHTEQCRRCGELHWSTAEDPGTGPRILGAVDIACDRRSPAVLDKQISNPGPHPVRGAVGFAFQTRDEPVLPPWVAEPVEIPAGGVHVFRVHLDLTAYPTVKADPHTGFVLALLDGVYLVSPVVLGLS